MKVVTRVLCIGLVLACVTSAAAQSIPGRYIVVLNDSVQNPKGFAAANGVTPDQVYKHALKGFAANIPAQALKGLQKNPHVAWIQADRVMSAIAQTTPDAVARSAYDEGLDGSAVDVDIAIVDSGIDLDHPDLNVVTGVNCLRLDKKTGQCKSGGDDDHGHGTHVAGSAAAIDNGFGVVGTAPGARLYAVKVLNRSGSGSSSTVIQGLDWVAQNAGTIEVANMSLGGAGSDDTDGGDCSLSTDAEHIAICNLTALGVIVVVAAGNEGTDAQFSTPSAYDEVITVSAMADFDGIPGGLGTGNYAFSDCTESVDDSFACFSNYGHDVDIMASGVGVYSTTKGGSYGSMSGTSMASPIVAGAVARIMANNPGLDKDGVMAILAANGDTSPCATGACGDDPDGIQEPFLMASPAQPDCTTDAECDDSNECTTDACSAGKCTNSAVSDDTLCGTGGLCCGGVCSSPACSADGECADDGETCTAEACINPGTCAASCQSSWPACGVADSCCGPSCTGASDIDCPQGPTSAHVSDIVMWANSKKGKYKFQVVAQVQIVDDTGAVVANATVDATLLSASGSSYTYTLTTDSGGWTGTMALNTSVTGVFTTTVIGVSHGSLSYAPGDNVESCQGLDVPSGTEIPCP